MQSWTVSLSSAPSEAIVGRKSAALGRLIEAGFPVPPGICITIDAFRAACAQPGDFRLPEGLLAELVDALPMDRPLAVRSSAEVEDLPEVSHAGRYTTHLNVIGSQEVEAAILDCWRNYCGGSGQGNGLAVLIQPLLDAECSGVCFSVDPVRQAADVLLVAVGWGLGAGVVEGSVPCDVIRLRRMNLSTAEETIAEKYRAVRASAAGGVEVVEVPQELRTIPCLPPDWLHQVGQFGLAIEQAFGAPQDVEWAIADGQLWILQSRPITALTDEVLEAVRFPILWQDARVESRKYWWNITGESNDPLYPAVLDYLRSGRGGFDAVYYGGSTDTRWIRYMNGRAYMSRARSENSPAHVRIYGAAMRDLYERLARQDVTIWEHWGPEIILAVERLRAFQPQGADGPTLADHLEDASAASNRHWMIHTMVPRMVRSAALLDSYARLTGRLPEELAADIVFLLSGTETIQTRLVEWLYDLACLALPNPEAAKAVALAYPQIPAEMDGSDAFAGQFASLMEVYGERTVNSRVEGYPAEIPLPWREAPEQVWAMVAAYLPIAQNGGSGPRESRLQAQKTVDTWMENACAACDDPAYVEDFRRKLAYARRNAAFLDEHNHYIDQVTHGQYYQALIYAGRYLAAKGFLHAPLDVFWLYQNEIVSALRASAQEAPWSMESIIMARRAEFVEWQAMIAPACLGLPEPHLSARPHVSAQPEAPMENGETARRLSGEPASRGRVSGRARLLIGDVDQVSIASGDIIVAPYAGTVLIPILPAAAGVVLDSGSPVDHFAISAREFGVPVVCATRLATQRISDGAWVTLDADTGTVTWD